MEYVTIKHYEKYYYEVMWLLNINQKYYHEVLIDKTIIF